MYYEVNSPLWSDNAAKTRAFVLPDGGTIHVKDCMPDAGAAKLAECVSPTMIPNGPADTGKWVFPVGTVMIKNFLFDGKLVETRLFMHVDAATAAVIQNGTDWVGYNYAWNEQQTEATIVPDARTAVMFNTGTRTVEWNYPNFLDCIGCHSAAVGTLGPETDQMNREVDGGNQIDAFKAMGLFDDTAPAKPYAAALVEPYANAALGLTGPGRRRHGRPGGALVPRARTAASVTGPTSTTRASTCATSLSLYQTGICNLMQQNGIPGMTGTQLVDFAPGEHAASAMWIRMNIPVPAADTNETADVGRMPPVASFVVDTAGDRPRRRSGSTPSRAARGPTAGSERASGGSAPRARSARHHHAPGEPADVNAPIDVARRHVDERDVGRRPVGRVEARPVRAQGDAPRAVADAVDRAHLGAGRHVDDGHRSAAAARHVEVLAVGRQDHAHRPRTARHGRVLVDRNVSSAPRTRRRRPP